MWLGLITIPERWQFFFSSMKKHGQQRDDLEVLSVLLLPSRTWIWSFALHLIHIQLFKSSEAVKGPGLRLIMHHRAWLFLLSWLTDFRIINPKDQAPF